MSAQNQLDLPPPRIWGPDRLAAFLRVSKAWIYQRTSPKAEKRIPRAPGVGKLLFDTESPAFREWISEVLGYVDNGDGHV
jgi:hypothetical protein